MHKIPITLGIIGHLDALVTNDHKQAIEQLLDSLYKNYPSTPITLFSQLAKGADTEVAQLFLRIKEKTQRDYSLIVPIPLPIQEYRGTFGSDDLKKFEELLPKADQVFELDSEDAISPNDRYRNGGKFVSDSSIILIALWDGIINDKQGGTSDLVYYKQQGIFIDQLDDNIFDLKGSLIHLPVNRTEISHTTPITLPSQDWLSHILEDLSIKKTLDKIEQLNTFARQDYKDHIKNSADYLYPNATTLNNSLRKLRGIYSLIDSHAIQQQNIYYRLVVGFFVLGFVLLFAFEVYKLLGLNEFIFMAAIGILVMMFLVFKFASSWKNHLSYIENRILAESLRVQFFWNLSGIKKSVSNYILRIHKVEYNWISHILNAINGITKPNDESITNLEAPKTYWINDQKSFFLSRLEGLHKKQKRFSILYKTLFAITVLGFLCILYFDLNEIGSNWLYGLIVLVSIVLGLFALLRGYYEKRGYEQLHNQYQLMSNIYTAAGDKINTISGSPIPDSEKEQQIKKLLYLTGKEALAESGNWYLIFKDKEPELEGLSG